MKTYLIIDARSLLPTIPHSGIPEYTRQLLGELVPLLEKTSITPIFFSSGKHKANLPAIAKSARHIHIPASNRLLNARIALSGQPTIENLVFARVKRAPHSRVVVFAPNINLLALEKDTKLVTTFHDLSFEYYPELLSKKEWWWHKLVKPRAIAKRSQTIISVSRSTTNDLKKLYGIPDKNIRTIYSGVGKECKPEKKKREKQTILYMGSLQGRKNKETILKAFALLKANPSTKQATLVLAGQAGKIEHRGVKTHGRVSAKERLSLYQSATLLIYPSLFEGFGFPPLEAMACGLPVIASYTSSLPEALKGAALYSNPHNARELAEAMALLLNDTKLQRYYKQKGYETVKYFSWQKTAKETLQVLLH